MIYCIAGVAVGVGVGETASTYDAPDGAAAAAAIPCVGALVVGVRTTVGVRVGDFVGVADNASAANAAAAVAGVGATADRYSTRCSPAASAIVWVPKFNPGSAIRCRRVDVIG